MNIDVGMPMGILGASGECTVCQDVVLRFGNRGYTIAEVLSAGDFRGELESVRQYLRESMGALALAEQRGEEVDETTLQQCSEQYRKERGLTSSAATEAWLAKRGLDIDDFVDFLERRIAHARHGAELSGAAGELAPPDADVEALVRAETIFTGYIVELAMWLARRAVLSNEAEPDIASINAERERFLERSGIPSDRIAQWCAQHGCDDAWFEALLRLETRYRRKRGELLTPEGFTQEMRRRRQSLMCVEVEALAFDDENAAREAYLCIAEDDEPLAEVGARAHGRRHHASVFLEGLSDEMQQKFLSAPSGKTFPPVEEGGEFHIHHVARKIEPDLGNEAVRQKLEHALITRYFDELVASQIVWAEPGNTGVEHHG